MKIYNEKNNQPINWFHQNKAKSNRFCIYCSQDLLANNVESNKEHLIARNFVPRNTFSGGTKFNFLFRACSSCNSEKADWERHISSVSLVISPATEHDENALNSAVNKANNDYHPTKKGVLIKDSSEQHTAHLPPNLSFGFTSPPQADGGQIKYLALRHIQGLFAMLNTEDPTTREKTRLLPPKSCWFLNSYFNRDWGNPQLLEVINRASDWEQCAHIITADGYFKALLKRDNNESQEWFWLLEWNKSLRVCGAIGSQTSLPILFSNLPSLNWKTLPDGNRYREEIPLKEDLVFNTPNPNHDH